MSELKRCPFCDSTPITRVTIVSFGGNTDKLNFSIECEKCGVSKGVSLGFPVSANFTDVEKSMEKVKKIWNTRAYEDNRVIANGQKADERTAKATRKPEGFFYRCECGYVLCCEKNDMNYCPQCGARLVEWI